MSAELRLASLEGLNHHGSYKVTMAEPIFTHSSGMQAVLTGDSCDNIEGAILKLNSQREQYRGKFYCFPYVENLTDYIKNNEVEYIDYKNNEISFKNGPILFPYPLSFEDIDNKSYSALEKAVQAKHLNAIPSGIRFIARSAESIGEYIKVNSFTECSNSNLSENLCANISFLDPAVPDMKREYIIFCWDCEKLGRGVADLQKNVLFIANQKDLVLSGGYAVPDYALSNFYSDKRYESYYSKILLKKSN